VRGQGTGLFGSAEGSFRTRRGIEKTLFQFTIVLAVLFIVVSILIVRNFYQISPSFSKRRITILWPMKTRNRKGPRSPMA
jgi:preprotein translocase subunit SecG